MFRIAAELQQFRISSVGNCTSSLTFAPFDRYEAQVSQAPGWRAHELPCRHMAMLDMPEEVADLLLLSA